MNWHNMGKKKQNMVGLPPATLTSTRQFSLSHLVSLKSQSERKEERGLVVFSTREEGEGDTNNVARGHEITQ